MKKSTFLTLLVFLFCVQLSAQTVVVSGQIRPRAEYRHGYKSLIAEGVDPAFAISQRTRLNLFYASKLIRTNLSLQDVRLWGDVATANKSDLNGTMIHEAWGEIMLAKKLSVKAGRQQISYDDQRLFGALDWVQQARSHDALLLKFTPTDKLKADLGIAYNQSTDKDTGNFYAINNYRAMQHFWLHYEAKALGISFLFVNNGLAQNNIENEKTVQHTRYSQTIGPYLTYKSGKLKIQAAAYLQTGKNAKNVKKSAYFGSAEASFSISQLWNAGAGFQYLSGNSQVSSDDKDHEFSVLYGTAHKFNGWMDYFYAGNSHKGVGLFDLYLPVVYKKEKLTAELQLHYYRAAADAKDKLNPTAKLSAGLGTEADLMLTYAFSPELSMAAGYSQMFGTETLEAVKEVIADKTQNWAWIMLTFSPTFYKSEK